MTGDITPSVHAFSLQNTTKKPKRWTSEKLLGNPEGKEGFFRVIGIMSSAEKAALETPEGSQWVRRKTGTCISLSKRRKIAPEFGIVTRPSPSNLPLPPS